MQVLCAVLCFFCLCTILLEEVNADIEEAEEVDNERELHGSGYIRDITLDCRNDGTADDGHDQDSASRSGVLFIDSFERFTVYCSPAGTHQDTDSDGSIDSSEAWNKGNIED